jgi:hypothetical protein
MSPNYQNGKVYCIRSHQTEQIYIGSTTQPLSVRFGEHKRMDCSSREIMKFEDCYIEILEEFPCANKNELNRREGQLIRLHSCVNKYIAGRTDAEYYVENKTEILEKQKQYYVENKTEILEKQKQYNENNKEQIKEHKNQKYNCFCTGKYTLASKSKHFKTAKHLECIRQLSA